MKCPCCGFDNLPGSDSCDNCQASLSQDDVPQPGGAMERSLMEEPVVCLQPLRPLTVDPHTSLDEAVSLMRNHGIGCVLVTDAAGVLAGILTERDLLQKVAGRGLDPVQLQVADCMTAAPEYSKPAHPLGSALQRMVVSDIRYLPLVDDSGRPVGIVSSRDVIAYMAKRFREIA
ncbi:MAG TPA: CBS domain-containing protein [Gammaproteobacteria bacterium]|nr:CBS domain-containing protein [Gammaproteobacteria bacterium]